MAPVFIPLADLAYELHCRRVPIAKASTAVHVARILVVDDEDYVRDLIRAFLVQTGHEVVEARDGEDALRQFREQRADLVITDNAMPRMTGVEMVDVLRRQFPDVKVVAMSGLGMSSADQAKMDLLMNKPFTKQDLLSVIDSLLGS